jgi:hypothetical protein
LAKDKSSEQKSTPKQKLDKLLSRSQQIWTPEEKYKIARIYEKNDVSIDLSKKESMQLAYNWYREAVEDDHLDAKVKMQDFCQDNWKYLNITETQAFRESHKWLLIMAKDDYSLSQNDLGHLYMRSYKKLAKKDLTELKAMQLAHKWFKAAEKNDTRDIDDDAAECNLALLYSKYPFVSFRPAIEVFNWFCDTLERTDDKVGKEYMESKLAKYLHGQRESVLDEIKVELKSNQHEAMKQKDDEVAKKYTSRLITLKENVKTRESSVTSNLQYVAERMPLNEPNFSFAYDYISKCNDQTIARKTNSYGIY